MAPANLKLFVEDEGGSRGPLPVEDVRRGITTGDIKSGARFRAAEAHPWVPGAAWEALADLLPAPRTPQAPKGPAETSMPEDLSGLPGAMREQLLWFVADVDGVMGPVSGDFIVKGLRNGKIPITANVSIASWKTAATWVRAPLLFPNAAVGATTVRKLPAPVRICAFCLQPLTLRATSCAACGEPTRTSPRTAPRILAVLAAVAVAALAAFIAVVLARRDLAGEPVAQPAVAGAPSTDPSGPGAAPPAAAAAPGARGHLAHGRVAARVDVGQDATEALALSDDRIAVARRGALDVIDIKAGKPLFAAVEIAGARALYAVHGGRTGAVYAAVGSRLAAIDVVTTRVLAWIDLGADAPPVLPTAVDGALALLPDPARQRVTVIDASRHSPVAQLTVDEPILAAAIDDAGLVVLIAAGVSGTGRPGAPAGAAVYVASPVAFLDRDDAPDGPTTILPTRRIAFSEPPAAVAVASDGTFGAAVLRGAAEVVRIDLTVASALAPPAPRVKTCGEPQGVAIGAGVVLVTCAGGRAVALHDAVTLASLATIDLGGPAVALDVAPDRLQALVTVGAPAPGVAIVDLRRHDAKTVAADEPIAAARYGLGGRIATAFASDSHRILVLR